MLPSRPFGLPLHRYRLMRIVRELTESSKPFCFWACTTFSDVFRICGSFDVRSSGFQGTGFIVVLHDTSGVKLCGKAQAAWGKQRQFCQRHRTGGNASFHMLSQVPAMGRTFHGDWCRGRAFKFGVGLYDGGKLGYRELGVLIDVVK